MALSGKIQDVDGAVLSAVEFCCNWLFIDELFLQDFPIFFSANLAMTMFLIISIGKERRSVSEATAFSSLHWAFLGLCSFHTSRSLKWPYFSEQMFSA